MDELTANPAVAAIREERRVITVLVADLVGSTAIAERLGAEEARLVVGEAVARIVRIVERYGGTVKDLAGDGVLALFGAPVAHEDDAERALRAALEVIGEIRHHAVEVAAGWGIEGFGVRVGVNTGEAVLGQLGAGDRVEYAAFGDTVNTCARLQSMAEPGTVLASAATRRAAETLFAWSAPRMLDVRGRSDPVEAVEVLDVLASGIRHPVAATPLVGREQELTQGRAAVDAVIAGSGGILIVSGEPGVGKSRITAELRSVFESTPAAHGTPRWLEGRCVSYGESMPYGVFRDLVRAWVGAGLNEPDLRVRVALRRALDSALGEQSGAQLYPYLGAMLGLTLEPDAQSRVGELSPEALQYRTFEVVEQLLTALAADGPLTILLEDLHWADATSLALVERLLGAVEETALLIVLTARPERDHPWQRVRETASRDHPHRLCELTLGALSGRATEQLLEALAELESFPPEMRSRVVDAGAGNPFFLEELLRSLADAGALTEDDGRWRFQHESALELPPTVEQVILARIDRLDPAGREVLLAASVIGRQFGMALLGAVAEGSADLPDALRELQRLDLIREQRRWPEPEYRFKHALIQEGAHRTLVSERRRQLHARAARWLEERHADAPEEVYALLAHHWLEADDDERAMRYLERAGDRATRNWALDEAVEQYRTLLELLEGRGATREAAAVLFKLALALHTSMRFAEANRAYQRAFGLWQPEPAAAPATETLRIATSYVPRVADPTRAGWWADIRLGMQLFDRLAVSGPDRTILPSLAERWEISDDGLRYRFHLRDGLTWSDGVPLTADDVEYAVRRVLDPDRPGASVSLYFVLEGAREYYHRQLTDPAAIGVQAIDERTVEFRLAAPAPYFMNVVNRADAAPLPRHAVERHGDAWSDPALQVVSGPFRQVERSEGRLVLERRPEHSRCRGNVALVEAEHARIGEALDRFSHGAADLIPIVYSPRVTDFLPAGAPPAEPGPATWTAYLAFRHADPFTGNPAVRRALALAVDREALAEVLPSHLPVASGGIVPPALQGHTADIVLPFDPAAAAAALGQAGVAPGAELTVASQDVWAPVLEVLARSWREALGLRIHHVTWTAEDVPSLPRPTELGQVYIAGWLPGYPDPEYCLRLLLQSDSLTNEGGFADAELDELIDRARRQTTGADRLELFHQVDRIAVVDRVALIPLCYGRNIAYLRSDIRGWWEFSKSSASFADLQLGP
jgi:ABC-type transport system substrate-binding protein/class 3 adenylate cyclase